jgi:hypothetical protein
MNPLKFFAKLVKVIAVLVVAVAGIFFWALAYLGGR